jgi:hypothetical protein
VLNEHQDVEALQQHGVHVQEVDGEDPGVWVPKMPSPHTTCEYSVGESDRGSRASHPHSRTKIR